MRILGIDPGTSLIGYGIIDYDKKDYHAITYGAFRTQPNISTQERIPPLNAFFTDLIHTYQPERLAIESLFFFKNAKTVMKVSEMRGAIITIAKLQNLFIQEFTPLQVKQAVSGYGRASKSQVQTMVRLILHLATDPKPDDVADALALAICCANTIVY